MAQNNLTELGAWFYTESVKGLIYTDQVIMERAAPGLPADDLHVAKDFYATKLGFRVVFEASNDGKSGPLGLARGPIRITVDSPMDRHGRKAYVSLKVDDADAHFEEWREQVDVLRAPKDESWGARTFHLLDPFGNTIFVMGQSSRIVPATGRISLTAMSR